jgi:hypothetical protein
MENKQSDKNRLIKNYVEHQDCNSYKNALGYKQRGQGIYILYDGDDVYYIGLSKRSLRSRLRQHHTRDRHKGHWDNYSFYQISRTNYIKDIETVLLKTFRPTGNAVSGKFRSRYNLVKSKTKK